jgi:hypothetical protein
MMRTLVRRILPLAALALAAACSGDPTGASLREVAVHQQRWKSQHLSSYTFTYQVACFCPPIVNHPATVEVRDGQVVGVVSSTGEPVTAQMLAWWPTIDKVFEQIRQERDGGQSRLRITWNERLGYPTTVNSGWDAADAGYVMSVSDVHPAPGLD